MKISVSAAALAAIIWFILAVELTLAWNSVPNVYEIGSTGQLIPFIIGSVGFLRAIHLALLGLFEDVGDTHNLWSLAKLL